MPAVKLICIILYFHSMSVYHSLRNSTRDMEEEEEDMVVLDFIMESVSDDTEDNASTQVYYIIIRCNLRGNEN